MSRVEASIGKFAKQIETCRIEKERWLARFKVAKVEMVQLTKEISNDVSAKCRRRIHAIKSFDFPSFRLQRLKVMLEPYIKSKQIELAKAATECRSEHYCKIIRIYSAEMESSTKAVHLSGEIIQDTYYLLSAHQLLTIEMESKLNQLAKLHDGQRGVRFTTSGIDDAHNKNDHDDDDMSHVQNIDDITLEAGLDIMSTDGDDAIFAMPAIPPPVNRAKRALSIEEETISMPKRFIAVGLNPLNGTQVLETHSDGEENVRSARPVVPMGRPQVKTSFAAS